MHRIQKTIAEFLDGSPAVTVESGDTVAMAVEAMKERQVHAVLVLDDGALVGIFTGRDFLNRVLYEGLDPAALPLREVMTRDPECLRPRDPVAYAINRMVVGGFRNIPIVGDDHRPVALLDIRTITTHLSEVFDGVVAEEDGAVADEWTDIGGGG